MDSWETPAGRSRRLFWVPAAIPPEMAPPPRPPATAPMTAGGAGQNCTRERAARALTAVVVKKCILRWLKREDRRVVELL